MRELHCGATAQLPLVRADLRSTRHAAAEPAAQPLACDACEMDFRCMPVSDRRRFLGSSVWIGVAAAPDAAACDMPSLSWASSPQPPSPGMAARRLHRVCLMVRFAGSLVLNSSAKLVAVLRAAVAACLRCRSSVRRVSESRTRPQKHRTPLSTAKHVQLVQF